jgi:hypothetical protein
MLSAAKNLACRTEMLRCAQHDMADFAWEYSLGTLVGVLVLSPTTPLAAQPQSAPLL